MLFLHAVSLPLPVVHHEIRANPGFFERAGMPVGNRARSEKTDPSLPPLARTAVTDPEQSFELLGQGIAVPGHAELVEPSSVRLVAESSGRFARSLTGGARPGAVQLGERRRAPSRREAFSGRRREASRFELGVTRTHHVLHTLRCAQGTMALSTFVGRALSG